MYMTTTSKTPCTQSLCSSFLHFFFLYQVHTYVLTPFIPFMLIFSNILLFITTEISHLRIEFPRYIKSFAGKKKKNPSVGTEYEKRSAINYEFATRTEDKKTGTRLLGGKKVQLLQNRLHCELYTRPTTKRSRWKSEFSNYCFEQAYIFSRR